MNPIRLPKPTEPIANPNGTVTKVWLDYLRGIADSGSLEALQQAIEAANEAIAQLQQSGGLPADTKILGGLSVNVDGILANGVVVLSLVNDQSAPELSTAYGANPDGVKGFYPVSDTIDAVSGETTKAVGANGVSAIGLSDVADAGGGTLQKTQFDAKGRKTGTASATTDDLAQGATNKYFVDAPSNGTTYGRKDGAWVGVPSGTVTSVGVSVPTGFEVSGSPVTSSGTIAIAYASGYQGYTATEATKLAGIQSGAQQNVATNLAQGTRTPTTVPITSSTGSAATLAAATTSIAGVMSAADKTKLDGISPSSYVTSVSAAPGSGITVDNTNPQAPIVGYTSSLATNRLPKYTLSAANALTGLTGGEMVLITNLSDGSTTVPEPCWYDDTVASGTKWRRFSDRSIAD